MQIAIAENSRVALDQDEYEKRYAELTARYEKAKAKYDDIAEQIESKKAKRELFKGFISNFGEAGLLNPRVRCRDLEQPCAGSDCEIQGRYKIHIQERI